MRPSALLLRRLVLTATGTASLVAGCGGQVDDATDATTASGGSAGTASTGGAAGSGGTTAGSGGATAGSGGATAGSGGAAAGSGGATAGSGGAKAGSAGVGGTAGTAGSAGGKAGSGGSTMCPDTCAPGQSMCGSGINGILTCVADANGCGTWVKALCAPDTTCDPVSKTCVPNTTTNACQTGTACVGGEWCSPNPQGGADNCFCPITDAPEKLVCGQPYPWGQTVTVCYDPKGGACLPVNATELYQTLSQRFSVQCGGPFNGPMQQTASNGEPRCCYQVSVSGCVGRPLWIEQGLRTAGLSRRRDWSVDADRRAAA